jgi:YaiO family outer membrane protein
MNAWFHGADLVVLVYFLALNSFYALLLVLSIPEIWENTRLAEDDEFQRLMLSDALPPISILVPAYNESATIQSSVTAILSLEYRNYEVIVVNDGSKDDTFDRLREAFDLYQVPRVYPETLPTRPLRGVYRSRSRTRLTVIDKENGGKADSLNAAINASRWPLVIAVDADTLIEEDALLRLTRPFLLGRRVAAVGGTVRVANGCTVKDGRVTDARVPRRFLPGIQVVEYLRAFLFGRLGWNRLGGNLIISGAFGLFRKDYLLAIGGYRTDTIVEDFDLVIRLHRHLRRAKIPYVMPFIPDPVAWTEVPETGRILGRQRERWHRGLIASMWQYKGMLFNPWFGRAGLIAMPFYAFGEALAPMIETFGYIITAVGFAAGMISGSFALLFVLVAWGYGMLLSLWALALEEASFRRYRRFGDFFRLLLYAMLENFGYRQRTVWWRLKAFVTVWTGRRVWGEMVRKGFARTLVALLAASALLTTALRAQSPRVATWGSYEGVTNSAAWSTAGVQVTLPTARGDALWATAELARRFGATDAVQRVGGVLHPATRWWMTIEAGTATGPEFVPKNSWEADLTALVAPRASLGLGYRRSNYVVGPVDFVIPHLTVATRSVSWDLRVFLARNPSARTDAAGYVRATTSLTRRVELWILGAGGRESYFVSTPSTPQVRSLDTVTGAAGLRCNAGSGFTLRIDASATRSRPVLSRRGVAVGIERQF